MKITAPRVKNKIMNTELETIAPTKARVGISKCPVLPVVIYDRECNGLTNLKTASKVSFIPAKKEETTTTAKKEKVEA